MAHLADARVWCTLHAGEPSIAGATTALDHELRGSSSGRLQSFAILLGREPIGLCGLSRQGKPTWERDIYYGLGAAHWHRGIASLAVGWLVGHSASLPGISRLTSLVLARNPRSRRVLEKNQFALERTFAASTVTLPDFVGEPTWELALDLPSPIDPSS